jgi:transmembrane sensor
MGPSGAVQGGGRQKADARGTSQRPQEQPTWQQVARDGRYTDAFVLLEGTRVQDRAKDLMFAADVARLAGQHAAATPYLERVLRAHRSDAQAPLAAFTLGRLRLERLRKPHKAAQAFAKARALAPAGPLAEDALAREVEAWARAGATARARRRAERYLQRYPEGRRAGMVRRHGGLEP